MDRDGLRAGDVIESIVNAQTIDKTLRSRSRARRSGGEILYVIKSFSYDGTLIYTKGAVVREKDCAVFYTFVSAKIATFGEYDGRPEHLHGVRFQARPTRARVGHLARRATDRGCAG